MPGFLLDANLSPKTARHLCRTLKLDAVSLLKQTTDALKDADTARIARREQRVIITFDEDVTQRYGYVPAVVPGVIHLRLGKAFQFVPEVNRILERFFRTQAPTIDLENTLETIADDAVIIQHWAR